jgi:hypothetical protein
MRLLQVKYAGACARCGKDLEVGKSAMYEKTTGIFCVGCEPVEVEDIRHFRTIKAERRAARLTGKADRLERIADQKQAKFNHYRHDHAWLTQPGHIPGREKTLKSYEKGFELRAEAQEARDRAAGVMIYKTRVKGDAARADQVLRECLDKVITVGSRVQDSSFGDGVIIKIFAKSYRVKWDRSGNTWSREKIYLRPTDPAQRAALLAALKERKEAADAE